MNKNNETTTVIFFAGREEMLSHIDSKAAPDDLKAARWVKPRTFTRNRTSQDNGVHFRSALTSQGIMTIADLDGTFTGPCCVIFGQATPLHREDAIQKIRAHQKNQREIAERCAAANLQWSVRDGEFRLENWRVAPNKKDGNVTGWTAIHNGQNFVSSDNAAHVCLWVESMVISDPDRAAK